jgi:lysophospholipase
MVVPCPSPPPTVRSAASGLSPNETSWLQARRNNTIPEMRTLLSRLNIPGFDVNTYFDSYQSNTSMLPNIGIAISGGGYRSCLTGGGAIQEFDSREEGSTAAGHLGGLLQSSTYVAGLSGGSWLVGSIFVNNFTTISGLLNSSTVWQFQYPVYEGPGGGGVLQALDSGEYFADIFGEVKGKQDADFNISITDYWGRALSFQLVNSSQGGLSYTFSSIALEDNFSSGQTPMPILLTSSRAPGQLLIPSNATIYEFNPFEFGTFDPTTYAFVPIEFIGSYFSGGNLSQAETCVRGFDNAGYVMGTSSSLWNQLLIRLPDSTVVPDIFKGAIGAILEDLGEDNDDIAFYEPNPFYGFHNETSEVAQAAGLSLVDGGEDGQNIPLHPLIQPLRKVDIIFAIDSSADTPLSWPNGTSLVATYERSLNATGIGNFTSFPSIPDQNTFVNLGLNNRPTFFGCNSSNLTGVSPFIVYIPNAPYITLSNVSTYDATYPIEQRDALVQNGYYVANLANGTADSQWPVCVACAIMERSWERTQTSLPQDCANCFERYCWNGTTNSTRPHEYEPVIEYPGLSAAGERRDRAWVGVGVAGIAIATLLM